MPMRDYERQRKGDRASKKASTATEGIDEAQDDIETVSLLSTCVRRVLTYIRTCLYWERERAVGISRFT